MGTEPETKNSQKYMRNQPICSLPGRVDSQITRAFGLNSLGEQMQDFCINVSCLLQNLAQIYSAKWSNNKMAYHFVIVRILVLNASHSTNLITFKNFTKFSLLNDHESSVTCHFIPKIKDEGTEGKQPDFISSQFNSKFNAGVVIVKEIDASHIFYLSFQM